MNKQTYIILLFLELTGCNISKKKNTEISIVNLQENYMPKDEVERDSVFTKEKM